MAELDHRAHRSRQLYQKVDRMRKGYKGHETFIRNKDGELITTKMGILLKSRILSKTLKVQLYVTLTKSIVLYRAQYWTVRKSDESKLRVFERKI